MQSAFAGASSQETSSAPRVSQAEPKPSASLRGMDYAGASAALAPSQPPVELERAPRAERPGGHAEEDAFVGPPGRVPFSEEMGRRFGADFSGVRAYASPAANAACRRMGAEACARGDQVAFADAAPTRGTVAHELAHVIDQGGATPSPGPQKRPGAVPGGAEEHAEGVERSFDNGQDVSALVAGGQREPELTRRKQADPMPTPFGAGDQLVFAAGDDILDTGVPGLREWLCNGMPRASLQWRREQAAFNGAVLKYKTELRTDDEITGLTMQDERSVHGKGGKPAPLAEALGQKDVRAELAKLTELRGTLQVLGNQRSEKAAVVEEGTAMVAGALARARYRQGLQEEKQAKEELDEVKAAQASAKATAAMAGALVGSTLANLASAVLDPTKLAETVLKSVGAGIGAALAFGLPAAAKADYDAKIARIQGHLNQIRDGLSKDILAIEAAEVAAGQAKVAQGNAGLEAVDKQIEVTWTALQDQLWVLSAVQETESGQPVQTFDVLGAQAKAAKEGAVSLGVSCLRLSAWLEQPPVTEGPQRGEEIMALWRRISRAKEIRANLGDVQGVAEADAALRAVRREANYAQGVVQWHTSTKGLVGEVMAHLDAGRYMDLVLGRVDGLRELGGAP